jgi:hypothetical protein
LLLLLLAATALRRLRVLLPSTSVLTLRGLLWRLLRFTAPALCALRPLLANTARMLRLLLLLAAAALRTLLPLVGTAALGLRLLLLELLLLLLLAAAALRTLLPLAGTAALGLRRLLLELLLLLLLTAAALRTLRLLLLRALRSRGLLALGALRLPAFVTPSLLWRLPLLGATTLSSLRLRLLCTLWSLRPPTLPALRLGTLRALRLCALLALAARRCRLPRLALSAALGGARRIAAEPALVERRKRLRGRDILRRRDRRLGFAHLFSLAAQTFPVLQILRAHLHGAGNLRGSR